MEITNNMGVDLMTHRTSIGLFYPAHTKGCPTKAISKQHLGSPPNTALLYSIWFLCSLQCRTWRLSKLASRHKYSTLNSRLIMYIGISWAFAATLISLSGDIHVNPGPITNNNDALNCLVLNAQSLKSIDTSDNKIQDLQNIVYTTTPHIVSICETWLLPEYKNNDILSESL